MAKDKKQGQLLFFWLVFSFLSFLFFFFWQTWQAVVVRQRVVERTAHDAELLHVHVRDTAGRMHSRRKVFPANKSVVRIRSNQLPRRALHMLPRQTRRRRKRRRRRKTERKRRRMVEKDKKHRKMEDGKDKSGRGRGGGGINRGKIYDEL